MQGINAEPLTKVSFVNVIRISYGNASIFLVHQLVSLCPPVVSACARYTGIRSPPRGHRQPVCWAAIAHSVGNECPNIGFVFGQYSLGSLRCLNYLFAMFKLLFLVYRAVFNDTSM